MRNTNKGQKRDFEDAISDQFANHYYIHGAVGELKNIDLERKLVRVM